MAALALNLSTPLPIEFPGGLVDMPMRESATTLSWVKGFPKLAI